MLDHLNAHWPSAIKNRPACTRHAMIGAAITPPPPAHRCGYSRRVLAA